MSQNKKAQGIAEPQLIVIAEWLILLGAAALICYYVTQNLLQTNFEKNYLAKDIALLTDTVYVAPSNVIEYYSYGEHNFLVSFEKKINEKNPKGYFIVDINKDGGDKTQSRVYPFAKNSREASFQKALMLEDGITISKINDRLYTGKKVIKNMLELSCPSIATEDGSWKNKKILIDPGHSKDEKEGDLAEGYITGKITDSLIPPLGPLKNAIETRYYGKRKNREEIDEIINNNNPQIIISLHVGSYENNLNNFKAYYSIKADSDVKKKSMKLACLILNEISALNKDFKKSGFEISGTSISPVHEEDYENAVLPEDKVAILLEVGNIQSEASKKMFQSGSLGNIKDAIYKGIEKYFTK